MSLLRTVSATYPQRLDDVMIATALFATGIVLYNVYPYHIVAVLFYAFNIKRIRYHYFLKENLTLSLLSAIVGITLLYDAAALYYGINASATLKYMAIELIGFSVLYAVLLVSDGSYSRFVRVIHISFIIVAINVGIGLIEIVTPVRWIFSKFSDWVWISGQEISADDIFQMNMYPDVIATTPTGLNWNPNDFSLMIGLWYPFLLLSRKRFALFLSSAIIICVAFASARLVFYSMMFVFIITAILYYPRMKKTIWLHGFLFLMVFTNAFFLLYYQIPQWYDISIQSLIIPPPPSLLQAQSGISRFDLIREGLKLLFEHPWFGIGAGNFQVHMMSLHSHVAGGMVDMHLYWFQILVEKGLLYFLVLCAAVYYIIKSILSKYLNSNDTIKDYGFAVLASLFILFIGGMSISSLAYYLPMYVTLAVSVSYLLIPRNDAYSDSSRL